MAKQINNTLAVHDNSKNKFSPNIIEPITIIAIIIAIAFFILEFLFSIFF